MQAHTLKRILGYDLKPGDALDVWWSLNDKQRNQDRILEISNPKYCSLFDGETRVIKFLSGMEMTIVCNDLHTIIVKDGD